MSAMSVCMLCVTLTMATVEVCVDVHDRGLIMSSAWRGVVVAACARGRDQRAGSNCVRAVRISEGMGRAYMCWYATLFAL